MSSFNHFRNKNVVIIILCVIIFSSIFISRSQSTLTTSETISSSGRINIELSRLHTDGRWVRDAAGNIVRLKGAAVFWRFMYCSSYHDYDPLLYGDEINETSMDLFASTSANFIRLTVNGYIWHILKAPKYIAAVDTVIQWSKARGIMVVLDNHGWYDPITDTSYHEAEYIDEWQNFMVALAQRYKAEGAVIGFDLWNEPQGDIDQETYYSMLPSVISAIQAVDPSYLCFVEPWGSCAEGNDMQYFIDNPLPFNNVVYCAHNYYAWDYPWFDYAINYGNGNFDIAKQQMEQTYYERFIHMSQYRPVMNMETGVYRDSSKNPNWDVWENDSLALYEKYGVGVSWYPFDPDRSGSSLISILSSDRITMTHVGEIWAMHMAVTS